MRPQTTGQMPTSYLKAWIYRINGLLKLTRFNLAEGEGFEPSLGNIP